MSDWIRITCEIEGYENNWIEAARKWKRPQSRQLLSEADGEENFLELFRTKVRACNIEVYGDDDEVIETITDPNDITLERLDDLDGVVIEFLGPALVHAFGKSRGLDFTTGQTSSGGNETEM